MRHAIRHRLRLKYLNPNGRWPSGNVRYYFRPKGQKGTLLPDLDPSAAAFLRAYAKALEAHEGTKPHPAVKHRTGTIGAGVRAYLASDTFLTLAPSSRAVWQRALEDIEARYGAARFDDLETKHIRKDLAELSPHPANTRRKIWRSLCRWAEDAGLISDDPARAVRPRATSCNSAPVGRMRSMQACGVWYGQRTSRRHSASVALVVRHSVATSSHIRCRPLLTPARYQPPESLPPLLFPGAPECQRARLPASA